MLVLQRFFIRCMGFFFRSEFFFRTTGELEYLFFCCAKREIFFYNLTLGYMTEEHEYKLNFYNNLLDKPDSKTFFRLIRKH